MINCFQCRNKSVHRLKTALWNFMYSGFIRQVLGILKTSVLTEITTLKKCKNAQIFHISYLYIRHLTQQIAIIWEISLVCHSDVESGCMEIGTIRMKMLWKICDFTICHTDNTSSCIKYCRYVNSERLTVMLLTNKN